MSRRKFTIKNEGGEAVFYDQTMDTRGIIRKKVRAVFTEEFIDVFVEQAKAGSPYDTGNNRSSIRGVIQNDQPTHFEWYVATSSGYGAFLEFGTSMMPPRPYFAPAFDVAATSLRRTRKWL